MITQKLLKEILSYEPDTRIFRWKVSVSDNIKPGDVAGAPHSEGYIQITIDYANYLAHRLAFLWIEGVCSRERR